MVRAWILVAAACSTSPSVPVPLDATQSDYIGTWAGHTGSSRGERGRWLTINADGTASYGPLYTGLQYDTTEWLDGMDGPAEGSGPISIDSYRLRFHGLGRFGGDKKFGITVPAQAPPGTQLPNHYYETRAKPGDWYIELDGLTMTRRTPR